MRGCTWILMIFLSGCGVLPVPESKQPAMAPPSAGVTTVSSTPQSGNGNSTRPAPVQNPPPVQAPPAPAVTTLDFDDGTAKDSNGGTWQALNRLGTTDTFDPSSYGQVSTEKSHSGKYAFKYHIGGTDYRQGVLLGNAGLFKSQAPSRLYVRFWVYLNTPLLANHTSFLVTSAGPPLLQSNDIPTMQRDANNKYYIVQANPSDAAANYCNEFRLGTMADNAPGGDTTPLLGANTANLMLNTAPTDAHIHVSEQPYAAQTTHPKAAYLQTGTWYCIEEYLDTQAQHSTTWLNEEKVLDTSKWDSYPHFMHIAFKNGTYDPQDGAPATASDMYNYTSLVPIPTIRYLGLGLQTYAPTNAGVSELYIDSIAWSGAYIGCSD